MTLTRKDDRIIFFVMIDVLTVTLFVIFGSYINTKNRLQKLLIIQREVGLKCDGAPIEECINKSFEELNAFRDKEKKDAKDRGGKGICRIKNPSTGATGKFAIAEAGIRSDGIMFRGLDPAKNLPQPIHIEQRVYAPKEFIAKFTDYLRNDCGYAVKRRICRKNGDYSPGSRIYDLLDVSDAVDKVFLRDGHEARRDLCD